MANWYGTARSNYFKVKDEQAFRAALAQLEDIKVIDDRTRLDDPGEGRFALLVEDSDSGSWPSWVFSDDESDEPDEVDLVAVIAPHLAEGEVAVLMEAGAEKLRYITGWALAFNGKGEIRRVSLDDIYDAAAELGTAVTQVAY